MKKLKKCIIIPDSFKGTLSSMGVCNIIKSKVLEFHNDCDAITIPIADGGEGTVDCFLHTMNAEKISLTSTNAYNELISCYYARFDDTAVLEMAQCAGLPQVEGRMNPAKTTTYGVGTVIRHAVDNGCKNIIIGLGGSCTNDGGAGMAHALGTVFKNSEGNTFVPTGDTLCNIASIDNSAAEEFLKDCSITAMCDITNPLYGPNGAAYVFSPQKGADETMVKLLDHNLKDLSAAVKKHIQLDISELEGAGAAGGMGAGVVAFLGGHLKSGIETILDLIHFDEMLEGTDLVFTGEGRIDSQSVQGKVISGIAKACKNKNIPVVAIVGCIGNEAEKAYDIGVTSIFSINTQAMAFEESRYYSGDNLKKTADSILRLLSI